MTRPVDSVLASEVRIPAPLDDRASFEGLAGENPLSVVPWVGHLFEDPGALAEVARKAAGWFTRPLRLPA